MNNEDNIATTTSGTLEVLPPEAQRPSLSKPKAKKRERLEVIIQNGLDTFQEVGSALLTIREEGLYCSTHDTFEEYCREKWNISKTHANRLITASVVCKNIAPLGLVPLSESVVRPLGALEPAQQREVWQKLMSENPRAVTANIVTRVIHRLLGEQEEKLKAPVRRRHQASAPQSGGDLIDRSTIKDQFILAIDQWRAQTFGFDKLSGAEVIAAIKKLLKKL